jgi:GDP-4-dehydro-6-deoxy-D-mannose reductase
MQQPERIIVTGSTGFVGRHLLPALRSHFVHAEVQATEFDVTDLESIESAIESARPDAVVHLAAVAAISLARQDPETAWRVNLFGTLNLARTLATKAPNCWLLYASSADAYGASFRRGVALQECAALAPLNVYSATKAAADLALGAMAADGLRVVRLRLFNHTGPGQADTFVVPAFARQIARIEAGLQSPFIVTGSLDPHRDFLDVRDVCAAYVTCLERVNQIPTGMVYNIASGKPRRIGDVLHALLQAANVESEVQTDSARVRHSDIPLAIGDAGLAHRTLGWKPRITWEQTLKDVLADWRSRVQSEIA